MQNAILTGSHAYGTPRADSDIDIAVLMDFNEMQHVVHLCREWKAKTHVFESVDPSFGTSESATCEHSVSIRLGRFNLIACCREESFQLWVDGTEILKAARPVTREHAMAVFARLRLERGL